MYNNNIVNAINSNIKTDRLIIFFISSLKTLNFCKYLYKIGLFSSYIVNPRENNIKAYLTSNKKKIVFIKQISKSGRKVYVSYNKLKNIYAYRKSILILYTSKGILTNIEAMKKKIGGELICIVQC